MEDIKFIGREKEIEIITTGFFKQKDILLAVSGLNEVGKSSLVGECLDRIKNKNVLIIRQGIQIEKTKERSNIELEVYGYWSDTVKKILVKCEKKAAGEEEKQYLDEIKRVYSGLLDKTLYTEKNLADSIVTALQAADKLGIRVVFYIDEFEYFLSATSMFFKVFISLIEKIKKLENYINFKVIFCSRRHVELVFPEDMRNDFRALIADEYRIRLRGFNKDEMEQFYSDTTDCDGEEIEGAKDWVKALKEKNIYDEVFKYCGNHPSLMQKMKAKLLKEILENGEITQTSVSECFEKSENMKDIYEHLYSVMQKDKCLDATQPKVYNITFSELFLRSFCDKFDYNYLDDTDSAGNIVRTYKEKCNEQLYKAGFINKKNDDETDFKNCVAIAEYAQEYILNHWENELDKFMAKLDALEAGIRECLSDKILEFYDDTRDSFGNIITTKEENAGNAIRGIRGVSDKNEHMDKMWFEYVANHQKLPREYIYELDSLAFPDYFKIMETYWTQPHFECLKSDLDKKNYITLMKNIDGLFKDINDYKVNIPSAISSHFTLPINNRSLRNLTKENALRLCDNNLIPITFSRLRNIAKHRNNLRILNPEIYKFANIYCDKMLEDLKEGRALLHRKSIPLDVKNTIDAASEFPFTVTKKLDDAPKYEGYTEVDGSYYKIVLSCGTMPLKVYQTYVVTKDTVFKNNGIKTEASRQQYLDISLNFGKARSLANNRICTENDVKNEFSIVNEFNIKVTKEVKKTEFCCVYEISGRCYDAKLTVSSPDNVQLHESETYIIKTDCLKDTVNFEDGFVVRSLKESAICRENQITMCIKGRPEAEEQTSLSGEVLCEIIMAEREVLFEIKDKADNDSARVNKSGKYFAYLSYGGFLFETIILNSEVEFEKKKSYVLSKGCYRIEFNPQGHLQIILYNAILEKNYCLLKAEQLDNDIQTRIISTDTFWFKLKSKCIKNEDETFYLGRIYETEEATDGYFAKLSGAICSKIAVNDTYKLSEDIAKKVTYDASSGMFVISLVNEMAKLIENELVGIDVPSIAESIEVPKKELLITIKAKKDEEHYCGIINWNNGSKQFVADIDFTPKESGVELTFGVCYKFSSKCIDKGKYMQLEDRQEFELVVTDALVEPDNTITKYVEPPKQKEQKATHVKQEEPSKPKIKPEARQYYILTLDKNKGVFKKNETILSDPVVVSVVSEEKNDKKNDKKNTKSNAKNNSKNNGRENTSDNLNNKWVKVVSVDAKEVKIQKADPVISKFISGVCKQCTENEDTVELQVEAWNKLELKLEEWVASLTQIQKELLVKYDKEVSYLDELKKVPDEVVTNELCVRFGESDALKDWLKDLGDAKNIMLDCSRKNASINVLKHWKTVYDTFINGVGKREDFVGWLNTTATETQLELLTECKLKNPSFDALKEWIKWITNVSKDALEDLSLAKSCDLEGVKKINELSAWLTAEKAKILTATATDEVTAEAAATAEPQEPTEE